MRAGKHLVLISVLVICVSFFCPSYANAQETNKTSLNLQEALDTAYKNNPDIRKANLSVDKAQINLDKSAELVTYIPTGGLVLPAYQQVMNTYQQNDIALKSAKRTQQAEKDRICKEVLSAYSTAVRNYNSIETARINLQDLKEQKTVCSLAKEIGTISNYDYTKMNTSIKQAEEAYKAAKSTYDGSIAALGALLGQSEGWQPELTSRSIINKYERNSLAIEISRGTSESILVWTKEALRDIEVSKKDWVLPNLSSDMQKINMDIAEIDYEQAKRNARTSIEQLYYGIDALEGQIEAAEMACQTAQSDLENCQLKYDLGLIAKRSLAIGGESLASAKLAEQKARVNLENARLDLANQKAQFAYLTGQVVYEAKDWTDGITKEVEEK